LICRAAGERFFELWDIARTGKQLRMGVACFLSLRRHDTYTIKMKNITTIAQLPISGKKGYFYENPDFHRRGYRAHHPLP
jgi:hypothetical protein